MSKFSFNKVKNPVNETHSFAPKDKDPVTLVLKPIDTEIEFMLMKFNRLYGSPDIDQILWQIGQARIQGWENVQDEHGHPVPFNAQNFGQWLDLGAETMPYVLEVGEYTLNQRYPEKKIEPVCEEEVQTENPPQEESPTNSETTSEG